MKINKSPTDRHEKPDEDDAIIRKLADHLLMLFSDANLCFDSFLRGLLFQNKNNITFNTLLNLKSVKTITEDPEHLKLAVKNHCAYLLVLQNEDTCVSRKDVFDYEKAKKAILNVSLVITNAPIKDRSYEVPITKLYPLFEKFGKVALVKYHYEEYQSQKKKGQPNHHKPLGEAFVVFTGKKGMMKASTDLISKEGSNPKETLPLKDTELKIVTMKKWLNEREKEATSNDDTDETGNQKRKRDIPEYKIDWKPGYVLRITGLPKECDREAILLAIESYNEVLGGPLYVNYSRGQKDGAIHFKEPKKKTIKEICKKLKTGEIKVLNDKVDDADLLKGKEEMKYWNDFIELKKEITEKRFTQTSQRKKRKSGDSRARGSKSE